MSSWTTSARPKPRLQEQPVAEEDLQRREVRGLRDAGAVPLVDERALDVPEQQQPGAQPEAQAEGVRHRAVGACVCRSASVKLSPPKPMPPPSVNGRSVTSRGGRRRIAIVVVGRRVAARAAARSRRRVVRWRRAVRRARPVIRLRLRGATRAAARSRAAARTPAGRPRPQAPPRQGSARTVAPAPQRCEPGEQWL